METQRLFSLGYLAAHFQHAPHVVASAMAEIGEPPALEMNTIAYYSAESVEKLAASLAEQRESKAQVAQ